MRDFFKVIRSEEEDNGMYVFVVELNTKHQIYDGHFPGMPVTPGVCSLDIIKKCASEIVGRSLRYDSIRDCKFLETIVPDKDVIITLKMQIEPHDDLTFKLNCDVWSNEKIMMKLKAVLV